MDTKALIDWLNDLHQTIGETPTASHPDIAALLWALAEAVRDLAVAFDQHLASHDHK